MPSEPATDDTLTMQPCAAFRCGAQARTIWKAPSALTAKMRWKVAASSTSQLAAPVKVETPALLTSASMRPQRANAPATRARQSASSATSPCISSVSAPASSQAACEARASASLRE